MKPTIVQPKVEVPNVPATNSSPITTTSTPTTDQDTKEVTPKSRINSIWNNGWDILSKAATVIVIIWGGQGIYDRNFNQPEKDPKKEETKLLLERIKQLEEKIK